MTNARRVTWLFASTAALALTVVGLGAAIAVTRISFTTEGLSDFLAACTEWALPQDGLASLVVLLLGSAALVVCGLTGRSALRQLRATRRFLGRLHLVGPLAGTPGVWLFEDDAPQAFCAGLLRPCVFVSTATTSMLSERELSAVLAHEAHHVVNRDPLKGLLTRALAEGLFFLPVLDRLSKRRAALAEVAADEAAVRASNGPQALAGALLAFDDHPDPAVVGIAPERVDRLLGRGVRWELPGLLLVATAVFLVLMATVVVRLGQATEHGSMELSGVLATGCVLAMVLAPVFALAAGLLGVRRIVR